MSITLLVSVSLLTLVSTARPIVNEQGVLVKLGQVQEVLQAALQSSTDLERLGLTQHLQLAESNDDVRIVSVNNEQEQQAILSALDADALKAIVRLADSNNGEAIVNWDAANDQTTKGETPGLNPTIAPTLPTLSPSTTTILTFSCFAALLSVLCLTLGIHIFKTIRKDKDLLRSGSEDVWALLGKVEKRTRTRDGMRSGGKGNLKRDTAGVMRVVDAPITRQDEVDGLNNADLSSPSESTPTNVEGIINEKQNTETPPPPIVLISAESNSSTVSDSEGDDSETDNENEKFVDAESESGLLNTSYTHDQSVYSTPLTTSITLPVLGTGAGFVEGATHSEKEYSEKDNAHTKEKEDSGFSQLNEKPSPSPQRPAWSIRASSPQIPQTHTLPNPTSNTRSRPRPFAALPELDLALAMQLQPRPRPTSSNSNTNSTSTSTSNSGLNIGLVQQLGLVRQLGVGADSAWLVRFVMALVGWCAVLMSGRE